jgi:hypothetical protein
MLQSYSLPAAICRILIGLCGWIILIMQFFLMHTLGEAMGLSSSVTTVNYFSYFTILTNLLAAFCVSIVAIKPRSAVGAFFSRATVQTSIAGNILVTACVYNLVLAKLWNPRGEWWIADFFLHTAIPVLYVIYWLLFVPKGTLKLSSPFPWMLFPLVYLLYCLARGARTGWYPYPFVDADDLGYLTVLLNSLILLGVFLLFFYVFLLVDHWLGRKVIKTP